MAVKRKIIEINEELCDGCGLCVPSCAEGAIEIIDGKAKIVEDMYCDGLGACLGECPNEALKIIEREADEFDEEAVEEYLDLKKTDDLPKKETLACGCPSTQIQEFAPVQSCNEANRPVIQKGGASELTHWPVQIRLVPPQAPFLKNADLLVAADCTPIAYPNFHEDFLKGKTVLLGCPKFDDVDEYIQKFADIFNNADIKSVTVVIMEVPCCSGLPVIVNKGMEIAGKNVPVEKVVISPKGEVLQWTKMAA
ncbi:ATP-binding protein [Thermodesulfobacteriota bacterium]